LGDEWGIMVLFSGLWLRLSFQLLTINLKWLQDRLIGRNRMIVRYLNRVIIGPLKVPILRKMGKSRAQNTRLPSCMLEFKIPRTGEGIVIIEHAPNEAVQCERVYAQILRCVAVVGSAGVSAPATRRNQVSPNFGVQTGQNTHEPRSRRTYSFCDESVLGLFFLVLE
jgi:hypothetical protein